MNALQNINIFLHQMKKTNDLSKYSKQLMIVGNFNVT